MKSKHNFKKKFSELRFSAKLLIILALFHIFVAFFSVIDFIDELYNMHLFRKLFYDKSFNIRFGSYWDLAIQYSKRMWLFIPITILIFIFTIYNNIKNFKTKYKRRFLILTISIIILILVVISTIGCCYEWYDYWAYESV